jgi:hypothetical protein
MVLGESCWCFGVLVGLFGCFFGEVDGKRCWICGFWNFLSKNGVELEIFEKIVLTYNFLNFFLLDIKICLILREIFSILWIRKSESSANLQ